MHTLLLLFAAVLPVAAAEKPNTLTPQEVADGWISLFDGETTFGWNVQGEVKAADGLLILGGKKQTTATLAFGYFEAAWELRWDGEAPQRIVTAFQGEKQVGEAKGGFSFSSKGGKVLWCTEQWSIRPDPKVVSGTTSTVKGDSNVGTMAETKFSFLPGCRIRVQLGVPAGTQLYLRNVKLKPMGLQPIFNGKDLTNWKEMPDKKSKFTVTDKGELNIKDGPGDIQTEGQWDDFVLQLDCFSNGKHLNSGACQASSGAATRPRYATFSRPARWFPATRSGSP